MLGNFSGHSEGEEQQTKIADLKAKADEAKKETVYSQMASFLWSNKEAGIEHELYYPKDVACKIAGHTEWPTLEFQTRYSFIDD